VIGQGGHSSVRAWTRLRPVLCVQPSHSTSAVAGHSGGCSERALCLCGAARCDSGCWQLWPGCWALCYVGMLFAWCYSITCYFSRVDFQGEPLILALITFHLSLLRNSYFLFAEDDACHDDASATSMTTITSRNRGMTASSREMPFFTVSPWHGRVEFRHRARPSLTLSESLRCEFISELESFGSRLTYSLVKYLTPEN
jgi:hypothetical protein